MPGIHISKVPLLTKYETRAMLIMFTFHISLSVSLALSLALYLYLPSFSLNIHTSVPLWHLSSKLLSLEKASKMLSLAQGDSIIGLDNNIYARIIKSVQLCNTYSLFYTDANCAASNSLKALSLKGKIN